MKFKDKLPSVEYGTFYVSSTSPQEKIESYNIDLDQPINEFKIGKLVAKRKDGLWGLYDESGNEKLPHILDAIDTSIKDGLLAGRVARKKRKPGEIETNRYVYFDENGDVVIDNAEHARMGEYFQGVALVEDEECLGTYQGQHEYRYLRYFVDKEGKKVTPSQEYRNKITIDNWMIIEFSKRQDYSAATAIFSCYGYCAYDHFKDVVRTVEKQKVLIK